jgi:hypothetical protein
MGANLQENDDVLRGNLCKIGAASIAPIFIEGVPPAKKNNIYIYIYVKSRILPGPPYKIHT